MIALHRICQLFAAVFLLLAVGPVGADCGFRLGLPEVNIATVVDGDTFVREDGERLRLASLNTPELARKNTPAQPLAQEAREHVREFVSRAERLYWQPAPGGTDRYGRLLGELYNQAGESVSVQLLEEGLGFYIAVAPLPQWWTCLQSVESRARQHQRGVWGHRYFRALAASELKAADAGFRRIHGQVTKLDQAGRVVWVELDGPVVLRLSAEAFSATELSPGQRLEVTGWLVDRNDSHAHRRGHKPLVMSVDHASVIRLQP